MKIYTEVIYFWDDDKGELVQESSKFYDYEGPLTLANDTTTPVGTSAAQTPVVYLEYPSNIGGMASQTDNWIAFESFNFKSQKPSLNIALYIPGGALNTSYKSEYETASLGALGASAEKVGSAISAMATSDDGFSLDKFSAITGALGSGLQSEGTKVGLLKMGERANILQEGAKTIMERAQGAVLNPFLVAAYKGPADMRTHDFDFQMLPQDENESKVCVKIVNAFKKSMLPSHGGGDSATAPSMLFGYPDTFTISFYVNGKALPSDGSNPMFNIGKSVLTGCELSFDTENVPLFFDNSQYPVSISMKLSFMEIDVMYREKVNQGF